MPARASEETVRAVERSAGRLTTAAYRHMEEHLPWYGALSAQARSWVGTVVHAGFAAFVSWYVQAGRGEDATAEVFAAAPRSLMRVVTLHQTLDLLRTVIDVVEEHIPELAGPGEEQALREAVLRYSRDMAFAAAQVYAGAAESRGAWDARLESLIVDAVLRGEGAEDVASRAAALGWDDVADVTVAMGAAPPDRDGQALERLRAMASRLDVEVLVATQGRRLVIVIGGAPEAAPVVRALMGVFGAGPVVYGPTVPHLHAAGRSARAAANGLRAAPAWADAPRPVASADLLPERVLVGDAQARRLLIERVYRPLREAAGGTLAGTAAAYLARGRSLEATARTLIVHPNTVRYRLGRIAALIGYDLADAREAYVVQTALAVGRLADSHASPDAVGGILQDWASVPVDAGPAEGT